MTLSNEIKPCPFCGSSEIEFYEGDGLSQIPMICCSKCPASMEHSDFTLDQLKIAWNKCVDITKVHRDIEFLLSLLPNWTRFVPKRIGAMLYGTGSYEGDLEVKNRIDKIYEKWDIKRKTELLDKQPK